MVDIEMSTIEQLGEEIQNFGTIDGLVVSGDLQKKLTRMPRELWKDLMVLAEADPSSTWEDVGGPPYVILGKKIGILITAGLASLSVEKVKPTADA